LPPVSATIRSRIGASRRNSTADPSSARASSSGSPSTVQLHADLARPEQQTDRLVPDPAGDEPEGLRGRGVEPLCVVNDHEHRLLSGEIRDQAEYGEPDHEPVRRRPGSKPEHGRECAPLRLRNPLHPVEQRHTQLMQGREHQFHL
jgi:hypothetical protein